jgi:hypothetical protein
MKVISPLNFLPYDKKEAKKMLEKELGWKTYGSKHHESRFTKFFQDYYLPTRFGYDKRKAHLSSLILSKQMSRQEALEEMKKGLYPPSALQEDKEFFLKKLALTREDFEQMLYAPLKTYKDYPSNHKIIRITNRLDDFLRKKGIFSMVKRYFPKIFLES